MEKTVEVLEAMFQKADSDLDHLSARLEFEFEQNEDEVNPAKLRKKLEDFKKEYKTLREEAESIRNVQKEAVEEFQQELMKVCSLVQKLEATTGVTSTEKPEELTRLEEMLGISTSMSLGAGDTHTHAQTDVQDAGATGGGTTQTSNGCKEDGDANDTFTIEEGDDALLSPASRRKGCSELKELTKEEFETVSSVIRGRVKLSEVNHTYSILWRHFKEEKNSSPLAPVTMHSMGMRVSGATGQAKLKVLKSLGLLKLSKTGEVTLT